jgi:type VI secretion system protein ImpA
MVSDTTAPSTAPVNAPTLRDSGVGVGEREPGDDRGFKAVIDPAAAELPHDRAAALASIRAARHWFEAYEPSSPVALLLRQAERLTGKRFDEVFQALPADLVERWVHGDA